MGELVAGVVVDGKYTLEALLLGAHAVWRAKPARGNAVALKLVPAGDDYDAWAAEQAAAKQISSHRVVRVIDWGAWEGHWYLATALLEGQRLSQLRETVLPRVLAERYLPGVLETGRALHAGGVVHGQITSEHFVLSRGRLAIVGFGRVRARPAAPMPYDPPELRDGAPPTLASDVWSLGIVVHELVANGRPMALPDGTLRIASDLESTGIVGALESLVGVNRNTRGVQRAVEACLSRDPAKRPTLRQVDRRVGSRSLLWAAGFAVVATVIAVIVAWHEFEAHQPPPPPPPPADEAMGQPKVSQLVPVDGVGAPTSLALDAAGARVAYTTDDGKLVVSPIHGARGQAWALPAAPRGAWFSVARFAKDGAGVELDLVDGKTGAVRADRVYPDGRDERIPLPAVVPAPPNTLAVATSPDGATARLHELDVHDPDGTPVEIRYAGRQLWRGTLEPGSPPLFGWVTKRRLIVLQASRGVHQILSFDVVSGTAPIRMQLQRSVGPSRIANGVVALIDGKRIAIIEGL